MEDLSSGIQEREADKMKIVKYDPRENLAGQTYTIGEVVMLQREAGVESYAPALVVRLTTRDSVQFLYCQTGYFAEVLSWSVYFD